MHIKNILIQITPIFRIPLLMKHKQGIKCLDTLLLRSANSMPLPFSREEEISAFWLFSSGLFYTDHLNDGIHIMTPHTA